MVMAPIGSAIENAFEIRKKGAYASNKETPMFVDEKRQGDLNTRISAPKNFGLTKRMLLSDGAGASASARLARERFAPMQGAARLIYFGLPIPLFAQIPREFNDPLVTFLGADIIYVACRRSLGCK